MGKAQVEGPLPPAPLPITGIVIFGDKQQQPLLEVVHLLVILKNTVFSCSQLLALLSLLQSDVAYFRITRGVLARCVCVGGGGLHQSPFLNKFKQHKVT